MKDPALVFACSFVPKQMLHEFGRCNDTDRRGEQAGATLAIYRVISNS
jgi:hypothetical protein